MINKEIVKEFCEEFKGRYLTVKKYKTLSKDSRRFHFNNHWNILHNDEEYLYHSYLNGGNGKIEHNFSKISFKDLDNVLFVKWENVFILFKHYKGRLEPIYLSSELSTFSNIQDKHKFYHKHGINVIRNVLNLDMNCLLAYDKYNAFTGEKMK